MNFFDADLVNDGGKYSVIVYNAKVQLPDRINEARSKRESVPEKVTLGVRPENFIICEDDAPDT
jgi:multiple sugar transport system ATP-binding protein